MTAQADSHRNSQSSNFSQKPQSSHESSQTDMIKEGSHPLPCEDATVKTKDEPTRGRPLRRTGTPIFDETRSKSRISPYPSRTSTRSTSHPVDARASTHVEGSGGSSTASTADVPVDSVHHEDEATAKVPAVRLSRFIEDPMPTDPPVEIAPSPPRPRRMASVVSLGRSARAALKKSARRVRRSVASARSRRTTPSRGRSEYSGASSFGSFVVDRSSGRSSVAHVANSDMRDEMADDNSIANIPLPSSNASTYSSTSEYPLRTIEIDRISPHEHESDLRRLRAARGVISPSDGIVHGTFLRGIGARNIHPHLLAHGMQTNMRAYIGPLTELAELEHVSSDGLPPGMNQYAAVEGNEMRLIMRDQETGVGALSCWEGSFRFRY